MFRQLPSVVALAMMLAACTAQQQQQTNNEASQVGDAAKQGLTAAAVVAKLAAVDVDSSTNVHVAYSGGTVTLTGVAKSTAERMRYQNAVKSVDGVTNVNDELSVNPHVSGVSEKTADAVLAARVTAAIAAQAGVNVLHVAPTAKGGVVTLSGHVPSGAILQTVLETTHQVSGVKLVINRITVGQ